MIEKGLRGGLTEVIKKHGVANNKYLPNYNKSKKSTYLQYLDANNVYRYAMNKKLPLNGYKWADNSIFTDDFIKKYDNNSGKGYFLEVDIDYPEELHSAHENLPFLPGKDLNYIKNLNIK